MNDAQTYPIFKLGIITSVNIAQLVVNECDECDDDDDGECSDCIPCIG